MLMEELFARGIMTMGPSRVDSARAASMTTLLHVVTEDRCE